MFDAGVGELLYMALQLTKHLLGWGGLSKQLNISDVANTLDVVNMLAGGKPEITCGNAVKYVELSISTKWHEKAWKPRITLANLRLKALGAPTAPVLAFTAKNT